MKLPLPLEALDDRLAIVGRSGYGKTNAAKVLAEVLLSSTARCCIIDPTDAWWGLRLKPDGHTPAFPVAIFGGAKGDLPLNEHSGETIGAAIAQSSQSCIVSMADFMGENARRRFASAFLSALYAHNREPLHLIVDEADTLAPQKPVAPLDNEVLARMQQIVRRGRIRGFVPWLITQRPAVISKDVLSQADGLIAFNLTASQDRDAIGAWIEGQADRSQERAIMAELPKLERGAAMVWLPGRGILRPENFPLSRTFDSGRSPKRGEARPTATLRPIDVEALRGRIGKVAEEAKANDPKALRAEIARLNAEIAKKPAAETVTVNAKAEQIEAAFNRGTAAAMRARHRQATDVRRVVDRATTKVGDIVTALEDLKADLVNISAAMAVVPEPVDVAPAPATPPAPVARAVIRDTARAAERAAVPSEGLDGPQQRILDALAWWRAAGVDMPDRTQVAVMARYSPKGGAFLKPLSQLRSKELVEYLTAGSITLTDAGRAKANAPAVKPTTAEVQARILEIVDGPQARILTPLLAAYPDAVTRASLADQANYSPEGGAFLKPLSQLRSLGVIDYRPGGLVVALPVLFVE